MSVDLHNHTILCNHATGSMEQYLNMAVEKKIKYFGFSDHAPMNFDTNYRMGFEDMKKYENSVTALKQKYKNNLQVLLGYEVDYLEGYVDKRVLTADVDYLIGSVHFLNRWGFDNPKFISKYKNRDIDTIWKEYFEAITRVAKSGLFDIIGHIDLIKIFNFHPKKSIKKIAEQSIKEIKKANIVVELNSAGLSKPTKEIYPSENIMELLCEYNIPITFGSDAHKPDAVGSYKKELHVLAKKYGYDKCAIFVKKERMMVKF